VPISTLWMETIVVVIKPDRNLSNSHPNYAITFSIATKRAIDFSNFWVNTSINWSLMIEARK
jgi:hypothetical protein